MLFARISSTFVVLVLTLISSVSVRGDAIRSYTIVDLGANDFTGLNDLGQAIGRTRGTSESPNHQLLYDNGTIRDLGTAFYLSAPNSRGQTIFEIPGRGAIPNEYLLRDTDGSTRAISGLRTGEIPLAMNNRGQILVGTDGYGNRTTSLAVLSPEGQRLSYNSRGDGTPFRFTAFGHDGRISGVARSRGDDYTAYAPLDDIGFTLGPDGGRKAMIAYNNVGGSISADGTIRLSSGAEAVDRPFGLARSLNDAGVVVGSSTAPDGLSLEGPFAALLEGQAAQDLNELIPPGFAGHLDDAIQINNLGQILATGKVDGVTHSYLLTPRPVPEPASWLVAATIISIAGLRRARRRVPCPRPRGHGREG